MKKLLLTLTLCAALAPTLSLAQDDFQIQDVEATDQAQSKLAEQQAKFAEQQAKIQEEQARQAEVRAHRNEKIADLQSQLMALETERANDMSATGARVVNGYSVAPMQSYAAPMMAAPVFQAPAPMFVPAPSMPAVLMDIYGPPVVSAGMTGGCQFGKCGR